MREKDTAKERQRSRRRGSQVNSTIWLSQSLTGHHLNCVLIESGTQSSEDLGVLWLEERHCTSALFLGCKSFAVTIAVVKRQVGNDYLICGSGRLRLTGTVLCAAGIRSGTYNMRILHPDCTGGPHEADRVSGATGPARGIR